MKTTKLTLGTFILLAVTACSNNTPPPPAEAAGEKDHMEVVPETPPPPADSATQAKAWMNYMTPGDMHKMLASMNGEWNEEMTMWMDPAGPPMKSTATAMNKMVLNGLYQESTHKGDFGGMPFEGKSTTAYDNARKIFVSTWIDNMGSGMMITEGTYDEASKTMNCKGKQTDPVTGKEMEIREVVKYIDDNTHMMEMYCTPVGGKEFKSMEIKMTRKAKKA